MTCCDTSKSIVLVRGDDTNFNGQSFLTLHLNTNVLDLQNSYAKFTLGDVVKTYTDISSGYIHVNYTAVETSSFPEGKMNGVLRIYDSLKRRATIESFIPFYVVSNVSGNAIATTPFNMDINVEQGGENILTINVEAGVTVEVGTTTTLPAGSNAYVENVGTPGHLVLNFGIPQGESGEVGSTIPWGNITGNINNQYDLKQALAGKQNVISDLSQIRSGAAAGATALQPSDIINNTNSTSTNKALSANMGKELQDEIDNLKARGRFLSLWNCTTGLPETNPTESPYYYASGDYYVIGTIAGSGGTNYKPSGLSYTIGVASTTVETEEVAVDDCYFFDGQVWHLQSNAQKTLSFANIAGSPYDNTNLGAALNAKQDELVEGTGISIDSTTNTISNSGVRSVSTGTTNGTISVNTGGTSTDVSVAGLGTAAFTSSTDYATFAQGEKADSAIQDVQINGTSVVSGTTANITTATNNEAQAKSSTSKPLTPSNVDAIVKAGITSNTNTLSSSEKTAATNWILPSQTGNNGKFLTTNGTTASWATVDALPSQTGNADKVLGTDGTTATWDYPIEFVSWSDA